MDEPRSAGHEALAIDDVPVGIQTLIVVIMLAQQSPQWAFAGGGLLPGLHLVDARPPGNAKTAAVPLGHAQALGRTAEHRTLLRPVPQLPDVTADQHVGVKVDGVTFEAAQLGHGEPEHGESRALPAWGGGLGVKVEEAVPIVETLVPSSHPHKLDLSFCVLADGVFED